MRKDVNVNASANRARACIREYAFALHSMCVQRRPVTIARCAPEDWPPPSSSLALMFVREEHAHMVSLTLSVDENRNEKLKVYEKKTLTHAAKTGAVRMVRCDIVTYIVYTHTHRLAWPGTLFLCVDVLQRQQQKQQQRRRSMLCDRRARKRTDNDASEYTSYVQKSSS